MKFKEINRRYTEKVAEYLAKGYTINAGTMNGSQGELAHIDLTDGEKVVRILLERTSGYGDWWYEGYRLVVGIATDNVEINVDNSWATIWNNRLDIVEEEIFYKASMNSCSDWYVTAEESKANYEKTMARYKNRDSENKDTDLGEAGAKIVLPFVRKQYRCGRAKVADIKVIKKFRPEYGTRWYVKYKNHSWELA